MSLTGGKPVQIVSFKEDRETMVFREDEFKKVVWGDRDDDAVDDGLLDRVAIVSVVGPQRSGKSTLLNYLLHEFNAQPNFSVNEPFDSREGYEPVTRGLWIFSKPARIERDGKPLLVFLVDAQGMYTGELTREGEKRLLTFSLLLSSYLIFNVQGLVGSNHFEDITNSMNLAFEAENRNNDSASFQVLEFALRDYHFPSGGNPFAEQRHTTEYRRYLIGKDGDGTNQAPEYASARNFILGSFQTVTCHLIPHPLTSGPKATSPFEMNETRIRTTNTQRGGDFVFAMRDYAMHVRNKLCPKIIGDTPVTLLLLVKKAYRWATYLSDRKSPNLLHNAEISLDIQRLACEELRAYKRRIDQETTGGNTPRDNVATLHEQALNAATARYDTSTNDVGERQQGRRSKMRAQLVNECKRFFNQVIQPRNNEPDAGGGRTAVKWLASRIPTTLLAADTAAGVALGSTYTSMAEVAIAGGVGVTSAPLVLLGGAGVAVIGQVIHKGYRKIRNNE